MTDAYSTTSALIPFVESTIQNTTVQTVDARTLHTFLDVKTDFRHWIIRRIEMYGFLQDIDFVAVTFDQGPVRTIEYHVTIDMAKELSMVERTQKGKEARQYFLACERAAIPAHVTKKPAIPRAVETLNVWLEAAKLLEVPQHIAQIEAIKAVERDTGMNLRPLLQQAPAQEAIPDDEHMLEPTELAKELKVKSGMAMNKLLASLGWQYRDEDSWKLTKTGEERSGGKPRATAHAWTSEHGTKSGYNLRWNVALARQALREVGLLN